MRGLPSTTHTCRHPAPISWAHPPRTQLIGQQRAPDHRQPMASTAGPEKVLQVRGEAAQGGRKAGGGEGVGEGELSGPRGPCEQRERCQERSGGHTVPPCIRAGAWPAPSPHPRPHAPPWTPILITGIPTAPLYPGELRPRNGELRPSNATTTRCSHPTGQPVRRLLCWAPRPPEATAPRSHFQSGLSCGTAGGRLLPCQPLTASLPPPPPCLHLHAGLPALTWPGGAGYGPRPAPCSQQPRLTACLLPGLLWARSWPRGPPEATRDWVCRCPAAWRQQ